ncbi:SseB family protein [Pseudarthrobacter sp. AL07]|uniref:SseB family protein n=1 Tax=unclassified Pseudarthrobacter TaxID=2647000 RepID=UPI00249C6714|nr:MULTISPECIES: SseB family protein [unclassified Pseudarthrobacter]MDI3195376.1 SseB family protein [Pseudarthrobacter sp. AL20]MDI3209426.1 SseB family protein [Pseudarthrobacter sp. AL07]
MDSTHNAGPAAESPSPRHLPGHIAAALAGAGGRTDSAGQPWEGRSLAGVDGRIHNFEDDDGTADAGYLAAVAALVEGAGDEAAVVASLASARVFIPIIAQLGEEAAGVDGLSADKQADMALVTLKAADGRTAMPAFSSADALAAWHPEARPVAVYAARAALSAVAEGAELLVLDPGSEVTFVVRRPAVWALAQQQDWIPSYTDAALEAEMTEVTAAFPVVRRLALLPGSGVTARTGTGATLPGGGAGPELQVLLHLEDGLDAAAVRELVSGIQHAWSRNVLFGERVDSIEIKLRRAAH